MQTKEISKKKKNPEPVYSDSTLDIALGNLFKSIDVRSNGYITSKQFWKEMAKGGILKNDPRLQKVRGELEVLNQTVGQDYNMSLSEFKGIIGHYNIVKRCLTGDVVIPDFSLLTKNIVRIYKETMINTRGQVANYIPQLARVNPDYYGVSVCTINGQRFGYGDSERKFCLQSTCKPINYCIAHEELGADVVHNHIGREPSGRSFNEMALNGDGLPHNPLINSGAIMCSSLIQRDLDVADRFDHVLKVWSDLSGNIAPTFNNSVYLSEKQTADRNFALAYFMRENNAFPENTNIIEILEFYFQCCSIELTVDALASVAGTLANGGVNPLTDKKVFSASTVKNCLSLMNSCGMYDFSGEFAFTIGFPAKSGVSGGLMVVIPNVMGIALWSPRLDELGNSVRGVEFCKKLVEQYSFHNYDVLIDNDSKTDPRKKKFETKIDNLIALICAASVGDIDEIQRLEALGVDLDAMDYDGRTAIHLAASEGQLATVKYLATKKANMSPVDRWGGTPLKDAKRGKYTEVVKFLEKITT